jgi:hypothetical protein
MGCTDPITTENSVPGAAEGAGDSMIFAHDPVNFQLVVGRQADNIVTLFRPYQRAFLPLVLRYVFLIPPRALAEVSSSLVRGIVGPTGWENVVRQYVPEATYQFLVAKVRDSGLGQEMEQY